MVQCRRTRKRWDTTLTGVVSTLLLFAPEATGQTCELVTSTLSSTCGGACLQYEPCIVYNACPTGVSCTLASHCAVQCYAEPVLDPATFVFLVTFGSYKSDQEIVSVQRDGESVKEEAPALPDDTDTIATASNDAVTNIGTIELQPTVTSFIVVGGKSVNNSVKSKVANVTFASDIISTHTSVTNVRLNNVNLSHASTLHQLPVAFPTSIQTLSLTNTLLSAFPTVVAKFTNLQTLIVDKNYITEVAATAALNSLVHLSFQTNLLTSFRAVFPNLATLNLSGNNLTEIPASVFIHDSLTELQIKGNPLAAPWFTRTQTAFLTALSALDLDNTDFSKSIDSCNAGNRRQVHSLTVCLSDHVRAETTTWSDHLVFGSSVFGSVSLLGFILCIGRRLYRSRVRKHPPNRSMTARESYFGGLAPPLTRSPAHKGYRGGRQTPASGGPRFCHDVNEDAHTSSPHVSTQSTRSNQSSTAYSLWNDEELLSLQVQYEEIEDVGTISSGAFGIVWLVKYRGSQLLASKRLRADQITKQRTQAFIEEIKMAAPFEHPNVVRLIGCAWTIESNLQALFEYMENGDLRDYLIDPTSPRHWSQELVQLAVDIVEALVYVHSFTPALIHRDLKSRNVLLTGELTAKVTDFGASRYKSVDETMTSAVGTGRWLAPEVIQGSNKYDQSVDIFAFGCVLSELDTHSIPYEDVQSANGDRLNDIAILQLVATGQLRPRFGANCPPELRLLADRCLDQNPTNRPPAHMVAYELRVIQRSLYTLL